MMTKRKFRQNKVILTTLEDIVPADHIIREYDKIFDWHFIYDKVEPLYSTNGRPSIDPVVLFKMLFINIVFGINSMRKTCEECKYNMAYLWFIGYDIGDAIPNYSTWSQNYIRRFGDSDIFDEIFNHILQIAIEKRLIDTTCAYGDSTHQKASANKNKYIRKEVEIKRKQYEDQLLEEINEQRREDNKEEYGCLSGEEIIFDEDTGEEKIVYGTKEIKQSVTDPDSGDYHKGEHERQYAYSQSVFCDSNNLVLAYSTDPGNLHDSVTFFHLYDKLKQKFTERFNYICLDSGYRTPAVCKAIIDDGKTPVLPYKRPLTKKGYFKKYEYEYHPESNSYTCPNGHELKYKSVDNKGYRIYKSDPRICRNCQFRDSCTKSKNAVKVLTRHIWADYVDQAEAFRHTPNHKLIYPMRKITIERVFAENKENHTLRYTRLRGIKKNAHQGALIFAFHNLIKIRGLLRRKEIYSSLEA